MTWRCRFGWHPWSVWGKPTRWSGTAYPYGIESLKLSISRVWQKRTCPHCQRVQIRVITNG